jgi:hypothetical protein
MRRCSGAWRVGWCLIRAAREVAVCRTPIAHHPVPGDSSVKSLLTLRARPRLARRRRPGGAPTLGGGRRPHPERRDARRRRGAAARRAARPSTGSRFSAGVRPQVVVLEGAFSEAAMNRVLLRQRRDFADYVATMEVGPALPARKVELTGLAETLGQF